MLRFNKHFLSTNLTFSILEKALTFLLGWAIFSGSAFAQTSTYSNTNTVGNSIGATTECGVASLTRTFVVPGTDDFTVGDLNVGFLASHPYRGDIVVDLTAPDAGATTVRIIAVNGGAGFPNYNVELDDDNGTALNTGGHANGDGTTAPPFENPVSPSNPLSEFNNLNSVGTWTMTICDDFAALDDGNFLRADLFFTHQVPNADLSMEITANDNTPDIGTNVVLTYTISNAGPITSSGVSAEISLPAGLSYVSDNGGSSYNSTTGLWTLPTSITATNSASLQITAFVESSGSYVTTAEVETSDITDVDSTPGNGITTEDDFDSLTLVPTTPPVPSLLCPGAASVVDWDTQSWAAGSMSNSYTVDGETIGLTITDPGNYFINDPIGGSPTPVNNTTLSGGYLPAQNNLLIVANPPDQSDFSEMQFSVGDAGTGVSKFQVTLFDIDFGASQFQDQLTVIGTLDGSSVSPTFITGTSNGVVGNVITGSGTSDTNQGNGNVTIEFNSPIDSLVISYGNGPTSPVNPLNLGIGIHDIFFCPPIPPAVLTAEKTTAVYDPLAEGLYAIPGNDVIYTIAFTNTGDGDADLDSVMIIDSMPSEIEFYNGDIDDGGPQTNPVIGIDNGSGLNLDYATDVKISKATTKPTSFATCTNDTLVSGYDPDVTFICVNPSGTMVAGDPDPSFQIQFRARIK